MYCVRHYIRGSGKVDEITHYNWVSMRFSHTSVVIVIELISHKVHLLKNMLLS